MCNIQTAHSADGNAMYSFWFIIKALKCALWVNHDDTCICFGGFELFFVEFNHTLLELYLLEINPRLLGLDPSNPCLQHMLFFWHIRASIKTPFRSMKLYLITVYLFFTRYQGDMCRPWQCNLSCKPQNNSVRGRKIVIQQFKTWEFSVHQFKR